MSGDSPGEVQPAAPRSIVGPGTLVPLSTMGAVMITLISSMLWINARLGEFTAELVEVRYHLEAIEKVVDSNLNWARRDMESWSKLLGAQNPDLDVPDPRR